MKKRLDIMMVEQGLAPSREKAKAYIMAGEVCQAGGKRKDSSLCQQRRTEAGKSHEKFWRDTEG